MAGIVEKVCYECGNAFLSYMSKKQKFCGLPCAWINKDRRKKSAEFMATRTGSLNHKWRGGVRKTEGRDYIDVYSPDHPFVGKEGYIYEHRLVIEKLLGRYLKRNEIVHHVNAIKKDNRIKNLMVFKSQSAHLRFHANEKLVKPEEILFDGRNFKKEYTR